MVPLLEVTSTISPSSIPSLAAVLGCISIQLVPHDGGQRIGRFLQPGLVGMATVAHAGRYRRDQAQRIGIVSRCRCRQGNTGPGLCRQCTGSTGQLDHPLTQGFVPEQIVILACTAQCVLDGQHRGTQVGIEVLDVSCILRHGAVSATPAGCHRHRASRDAVSPSTAARC